MIIDCHGHYTTAPNQLELFRDRQLAGIADGNRRPTTTNLGITDDQIRQSLEGAQLKFQRERGTDVTIFSPRAAGMAHHVGTAETSQVWSRICNDLIHRVCTLYPENFVGVCQLPQHPGVPPANCIDELKRCVEELGFIGCNLNPDPSGGYWKDPPLTDRYWYPLYEKMVELDVPAHGPRQLVVQSVLPCHRGPLHQRRHHRLHAVHHRGPVQGLPDVEVHHPARRRRGAVSLGTLSRARPGHETAAAAGPPAQERVLRHLRLSPAGDRPSHQGHSGREHPVRLRDGRRREGASIRRPGSTSTTPSATSTTCKWAPTRRSGYSRAMRSRCTDASAPRSSGARRRKLPLPAPS